MLDVAHFINLNKGEQPFNLPYAGQIKRCEETERRLLYILGQCKQLGVPVTKPRDIPSFLNSLNDIRTQKQRAANLLFEAIENDILEQERFVIEQTEKLKEMNDSYHTMLDYEKVLRNVAIIMNRLHSGSGNVMASMHGGIQTGRDTETNYKHSLNEEEEKLNTPLL